MKFEEVYYKVENRVLPLYDIEDIYFNSPSEYVNKYKEHLFCPECRIARLSFNNAELPYFSTYPRALHGDDCSLTQDEASAKITTDFLKDKRNLDEISRQINSVVRILLEEKTETNSIKRTIKNTTNNNGSKIVATKKHTHKKPRVPRKRIDIPFRSDDYNVEKIFYGDVLLKWKYYPDEKCYRLLLYHPVKKNFRCSIKITMRVYDHIKEYKRFDNCVCKVVFIGELNEPKQGHKSNNVGFATLVYSEYLRIFD